MVHKIDDIIISLDFCFSTTSPATPSHSLEESIVGLDLTDIVLYPQVVESFFENCSRLEKFTYRNIKTGSNLHFDGDALQAAHNVKDINMDDSRLHIHNIYVASVSDFSENNTDVAVDSKQFLFLFTNISGKSCNGYRFAWSTVDITAIPQTVLMTFIRNSPSTLCWFRSN